MRSHQIVIKCIIAGVSVCVSVRSFSGTSCFASSYCGGPHDHVGKCVNARQGVHACVCARVCIG